VLESTDPGEGVRKRDSEHGSRPAVSLQKMRLPVFSLVLQPESQCLRDGNDVLIEIAPFLVGLSAKFNVA